MKQVVGKALKRGWLARGRKVLSLSLVLMLVMLLAAGCSKGNVNSKTTDTKPVELKLAHFWPSTHPAETQLVQPWIKDIAKATNGQVKITSYPDQTLLQAGATYDGVVDGIADIGISCFSYTRGKFPVVEVFELPGITYANSKVASKVAWEGIKELNPKEVQDTKLMMVLTTGPGDLYTRAPIRKLEDLKGMEIRATGISAKTLAALGANPVGLTQAEAYEALAKGVVKGNLGPDEVLQGWKQAEVTNYLTKTPFLYNTLFFVTMNLDRWNSLSPEVQDAIEKVNQKYFDEVAMGLWDMQNEAALKYAVDEKGMEVITLPPAEVEKWIGLVASIQKEYVANIDKQGLNGQVILDRVKELADKYNQVYQ